MQQYSFKKGLWKALASALTVGVAMLAFTGFSDMQITDLIEKYIFPVLGTMTVGGAVTLALNWAKIKGKG